MTAADALRVALGFVREHTPESSARLVGICCGVAGCIVGLGTLALAFKHPDQSGTVGALAATTSALVGSGAAAIFARSRTGGTQT